jgi:hypothetical protein
MRDGVLEVEYGRLFYVSYCITDPITNLSSLRNDKIWYGHVSREARPSSLTGKRPMERIWWSGGSHYTKILAIIP